MQIAEYQLALSLHKATSNFASNLSFEHIMILDQSVCTGRQVNFQILKNFNGKIGLNTTANKLYLLQTWSVLRD